MPGPFVSKERYPEVEFVTLCPGDPQAVACGSLVLVTLYPIPASTELKAMLSTSVYHYSRLSGEDSSIRLEITQKVKEGRVCSEWTPTANPLPRTQRK